MKKYLLVLSTAFCNTFALADEFSPEIEAHIKREVAGYIAANGGNLGSFNFEGFLREQLRKKHGVRRVFPPSSSFSSPER